MKKYTENELKKIHSDIINGVVYVGIDNHSRGVGKITCGGVGYIYFNYYGTNACKKSDFERFKESIYVSFANCSEIVPGVYSEYHTNYIPQDTTRYQAIDFSLFHPNVYGK